MHSEHTKPSSQLTMTTTTNVTINFKEGYQIVHGSILENITTALACDECLQVDVLDLLKTKKQTSSSCTSTTPRFILWLSCDCTF